MKRAVLAVVLVLAALACAWAEGPQIKPAWGSSREQVRESVGVEPSRIEADIEWYNFELLTKGDRFRYVFDEQGLYRIFVETFSEMFVPLYQFLFDTYGAWTEKIPKMNCFIWTLEDESIELWTDGYYRTYVTFSAARKRK